MAEPFLGEIRIFSFIFPPQGWALCNGQLLPINQNQGLFSLLGTTYGGNGQTTFGLPNLQGRVPIHMGSGHTLGETAGEQNHTLSIGELPQHLHQQVGTATGGDTPLPAPSGQTTFLAADNNQYGTAAHLTALAPSSVSNVGGSQPHVNMQPFLVLSFCIALTGIFPSQT